MICEVSSSKLVKAGTSAVYSKGFNCVIVLETAPLNLFLSFSGERSPLEFNFIPAHMSSRLSLMGVFVGSCRKVGESMTLSRIFGMDNGVGRVRLLVFVGYWGCWMIFLLACRSINL